MANSDSLNISSSERGKDVAAIRGPSADVESSRALDQFPRDAISWIEVAQNISGGITVHGYEADWRHPGMFVVSNVAMSKADAIGLANRLLEMARG